MIKVKIKSDSNYKGRWYFKGEEAMIDAETLSAFGEGHFEVLEAEKIEGVKEKPQKETPNKKLKGIKIK